MRKLREGNWVRGEGREKEEGEEKGRKNEQWRKKIEEER